MKKHLLTFLFSFFMITASAQKMSADGYTVSLSDIEYTQRMVTYKDTSKMMKEYTGNYRIEKDGKLIKAQKFSTLQMGEGVFRINFRESDETGNSLLYDFFTKEFLNRQMDKIPRDASTMEKLMLSALLIHAKSYN
ncbi:MAG: hypothetical protein K0M63_05740 [Weeksellaceae bacterium]|nr:hypothetical protein [Weeksellaceae bacterium]